MVKSDQIVQMTRSYLSFRIVISGIFFIIIGLALIVMNYFSNKANDKYKVWKCDDIGVITNTDIQETTSRRKVNQRYVYITEYIPYIVYKYKVNGVEYRNNKISVKKKKFKTRYDCELYISNFQQKKLRVCYDPKNHKNSYLTISTKDNYVLYGIGTILIIMGIIIISFRNSPLLQVSTGLSILK